MKLFTVRFDDDRMQPVQPHIKRRYRVNDEAAITWLGHPFDDDHASGRRNEGRRCDTVKLDRRLICPPRARLYTNQGEVTLSVCKLNRSESDISLAPCQTDCGEALVLLQLNVNATTSNLSVECPDADNLLAQGYFARYDEVTRVRHPARFLVETTTECLVLLSPGTTYEFHLDSPPARIFGCAVHKGQRRTYSIAYRDGEVVVQELEAQPLAVPTIAAEDGLLDTCGLSVFVVLGLILGYFSAHSLWGTLAGGGIALGAYILICVARLLAHAVTSPRYHKQLKGPDSES